MNVHFLEEDQGSKRKNGAYTVVHFIPVIVSTCADTCLSRLSGQYGSAGWAAGQAEEGDSGTPDVATDYSESWFVFRKAFLFGVIVAAVAIYMRYSRRKLEREDVGYEKNLA